MGFHGSELTTVPGEVPPRPGSSPPKSVLANHNMARLEHLWSSLPQVTYLFDVQTRRVHFITGQKNKPQGYRPDDFRRLGDEVVPRLVHPGDMPAVEANWARLAALRDGEHNILRYRILHRDGTYRHMLDRQSVFSRSADGAVELIFGVAEDVTDQDRMREQVRDLSNRMVTLQIDERRRIAQDLHDSTGQHLTAAELALAAICAGGPEARSGMIADALEDARQSISEAKKEIRVLSYLLRPPGVSGAGLSEAIRSFASGFGMRAGLEVETRIEPQGKKVTDEIAVTCFRICQEALANVHRHACATKVIVALEVTRSAVTLRVTDNGSGLDEGRLQAGKHLGVGIPSMRERMERLGGSVRLFCDEEGTSLVATMPTYRELK